MMVLVCKGNRNGEFVDATYVGRDDDDVVFTTDRAGEHEVRRVPVNQVEEVILRLLDIRIVRLDES